MRQQERARVTRQSLLVAAGEHFAAQGYHQTTLNDLARSGNVTKGALYFHFSSKEAVAQAVVDAMNDSWGGVVPAVRGAAADALEALVLLTDVVVLRLDDPIVRGAARLLRDEIVSSPTLVEVSTVWRDMNLELLHEAERAALLLPTVEPRWVASEIVASLAGRASMLGASNAEPDLWELMNEFWSGMLPLVCVEAWLQGWHARPWRERSRPSGVGPADESPARVGVVPERRGGALER